MMDADTFAAARFAETESPREAYAMGEMNAYLNERLRIIADEAELATPDMAHFAGKALRYWGWYWRDVSWFSAAVSLSSDSGFADHAGFCENDKWGYPRKRIGGDAWQAIRLAAYRVVDANAEDRGPAVSALNKALSDAWASSQDQGEKK